MFTLKSIHGPLVAAIVTSGCATQPKAQPVATVPPESGQFDILIKGGRVIDGTGAPWFLADVGVKSGRIAAIGNLQHPAHA